MMMLSASYLDLVMYLDTYLATALGFWIERRQVKPLMRFQTADTSYPKA